MTFTRLAVTPDQITRYRLDTAPPKATDNRAFTGKTCQAEALAPDDLAAIVRQAIEERIDQAVLDGVLRREKRESQRRWRNSSTEPRCAINRTHCSPSRSNGSTSVACRSGAGAGVDLGAQAGQPELGQRHPLAQADHTQMVKCLH